jgi:hypothetical protein
MYVIDDGAGAGRENRLILDQAMSFHTGGKKAFNPGL